jgi:hypothetical protein
VFPYRYRFTALFLSGPRFFLLLIGISCLALSERSFAQISAGGTPPSFSETVATTLLTVSLPPVDRAALMSEDQQQASLAPDGTPVAPRFATLLDVALNPHNSGVWETLADGRRLWRLRIESAAAYSLHLLYDRWELSPHARLFIYDDRRAQVLGAFGAWNNWTAGTNITGPVRGSALTLELVVGSLDDEGNLSGADDSGELSISQVGHAYRNLFGARDALDNYGDSGPCQVNINCPLASAFQDEKHGVALIISGGTRWCTGTLINNTRNDATPYFLTANHCLNGDQAAWLFIFNYESPTCTDEDGPLDQSVANAALISTYPLRPGTDFALLQLSANVPESYAPFFCGWNRAATATAGAYGISHPSGDIKKFARDTGTPQSSSWSGNPPGTHWQCNYEEGGMEVGSSGSAVFDSNGRIIGQLTGGNAACSNPDNVWYGKFERSWDGGGTPDTRLSDWLDPDSTGAQTANGIYPPHPQSDNCPARVITALPFVETGSTALAANDFSGPCVGSAAPDVIYTYTPQCITYVTVRLCNSNYDTGLYVRFSGTCPGDIARACNDDGCGGGALTSQLSFTAFPDVPHYFIVDGDGVNSGLFSLSVDGTPCMPQLVTTTRSGSNIVLRWYEMGGFSGVTYSVYRADTPVIPLDPSHLLGTTTQQSYTDQSALPSGAERYFYTVTAGTASP